MARPRMTTLELRERDKRVYGLYLAGHNLTAISKELSLPLTSVHLAVKRSQTPPIDAESRRQQQIDRLEGLMRKWWPRAMGPDGVNAPDLAASVMVLRIIEGIVKVARLDKEPLINLDEQLKQMAEEYNLDLAEVQAEADLILAGERRLWSKKLR